MTEQYAPKQLSEKYGVTPAEITQLSNRFNIGKKDGGRWHYAKKDFSKFEEHIGHRGRPRKIKIRRAK